MGSGLSSNFNDIKPLFNLGFWKVHSASSKESNQLVSLWLFEYEKLKEEIKSRAARKKYVESCIYSIQCLKQYHHQNILKVFDTYEKDDNLAFSAEPVAFRMNDEHIQFKFSKDEVYYIADQLANLGSYLTTEKNMVSFYYCPEAFAFTNRFSLKLCVFNLLSPIIGTDGETKPRHKWENNKAFPPLNYTAPEYSNNLKTNSCVDIFSFGALITSSFINRDFFNFQTPQEMQRAISTGAFNIPEEIPDDMKALLQNCFEAEPSRRLQFHEILRFPVFNDVLIRCLRIIDNIESKSQAERYSFYQQLKNNLNLFSQRLLQFKILPLMMNEVLSDLRFGTVSLPIIYNIGDKMSKSDFMDLIMKKLGKLMYTMNPPAFGCAILEGMDIVINHIDKGVIHEIVYPILIQGVNSPSSPVQIEALRHFPNFISLSTENNILYTIIPQINSYLLKTVDLKVIKYLLSSYECALDIIDHNLFVEVVFPKLLILWKNSLQLELSKPLAILILKQKATTLYIIRFVIPLACEILTDENIDSEIQDVLLTYVEDLMNSIRKERNIEHNENKLKFFANESLKNIT